MSNHDQLALALKARPTYLGLSPVYATATKSDHDTPLGISGVRSLLEKTAGIPAVAIGGINLENLESMLLAIALPDQSPRFRKPRVLDGVAIVSAIITSPEPEKTCLKLKDLISSSRRNLTDDGRWELPVAELVQQLQLPLQQIRKCPPLIHHITNTVASTLSANVTLAIGASPIMSENPAEFEDLAALNNGHVALVLNMGTAPDETNTIALFLKALEAHKQSSNRVVFDPVGCGATAARRRFAAAILGAKGCDVIKGNEGEILSIAGEDVNMRGVDGAGPDGGKERERELAKICSELAMRERKPNFNPPPPIGTEIDKRANYQEA